jgi:hypothetical protein
MQRHGPPYVLGDADASRISHEPLDPVGLIEISLRKVEQRVLPPFCIGDAHVLDCGHGQPSP